MRFGFLRKGTRNHLKLGEDDRPPARRRANSGSSRGSTAEFDPNHYTSFLDTQGYASGAGHVRRSGHNARTEDLFVPIGGGPKKKAASSSYRRRQAVQDFSRGPSDMGSTFGGKPIEELMKLDAKVLALAPSEDVVDSSDTDDEHDREVMPVRPVMIKAIQLRRQQGNPAEKAQLASDTSEQQDTDPDLTRDRTWDRRISALDAVFGTEQASKPQPRVRADRPPPEETRIVRVLSVETPNSFPSKSQSLKKSRGANRSGLSWIRRKKKMPVFKMDSKQAGNKTAAGYLSSQRQGSSIASSTTGTDIYSAATSTSGSSTEESFSLEERLRRRRPLKSSIEICDDDDGDDTVLSSDLGTGCHGCNPVAPCRTVALDLGFFVGELLDQEIVLKEDSFFNQLMRPTESNRQKQPRRQQNQRKRASPKKKFIEFS